MVWLPDRYQRDRILYRPIGVDLSARLGGHSRGQRRRQVKNLVRQNDRGAAGAEASAENGDAV